MSSAARKRWFRFSLRGLFLAVTLVGCWLGYELNWIRQRHAFIAEQRSLVESWMLYTEDNWTPNDCSAPALLGLFGERGHARVLIWVDSREVDHPPTADGNRVARARQLFPEAHLVTGFNADGQTSWSAVFYLSNAPPASVAKYHW